MPRRGRTTYRPSHALNSSTRGRRRRRRDRRGGVRARAPRPRRRSLRASRSSPPTREVLLRPAARRRAARLRPPRRGPIAARRLRRLRAPCTARVSAVEPGSAACCCAAAASLRYDTLVLAPGARRLPAFDDALHIGDERARGLETLREEILAGTVRSVAFVAPTLTGWLLPLYEAALLTARLGARVSAPHAGAGAARAVRRRRGGSRARRRRGRVRRRSPAGRARARGRPDRVVAAPARPAAPGRADRRALRPDPDRHVLPRRRARRRRTRSAMRRTTRSSRAGSPASRRTRRPRTSPHPVTATPFVPLVRATLLTGGEPIELGDDEAPGKLPGRYLSAVRAQLTKIAIPSRMNTPRARRCPSRGPSSPC